MCNRRPQAPRIEFEMKNGLQLNSKYWEPFFHDGAALDLGHLEPIEFPCATPDKNTRLVRVIFSPHVFTRGACKDDQEAEICFDQRVYCPDRYAASLRLPEVMLDLPNAKVYQTWEKRNYLHMLTIDEDSEPYHIFFEVSKAGGKRNRHILLRVESAYKMQKSAYTPPARPNSIRFPMLIQNIFLQREIKFSAR